MASKRIPPESGIRGGNDPFVVLRFPEVRQPSRRLPHHPGVEQAGREFQDERQHHEEEQRSGANRDKGSPSAALALAGPVMVIVQDHESFTQGTLK